MWHAVSFAMSSGEASREKYDGFFLGHYHVSDGAVGLAYSKAVEGCLNGQIFIVD
jgi:hypothetical protein